MNDLILQAYPENDEQDIVTITLLGKYADRYCYLFRAYEMLKLEIGLKNWNGSVVFVILRGEEIKETFTKISLN